jgi:hypothetical protein
MLSATTLIQERKELAFADGSYVFQCSRCRSIVADSLCMVEVNVANQYVVTSGTHHSKLLFDRMEIDKK